MPKDEAAARAPRRSPSSAAGSTRARAPRRRRRRRRRRGRRRSRSSVRLPCRCAGRPGPRPSIASSPRISPNAKSPSRTPVSDAVVRAPRLSRRLGAAAIARRAAGVPRPIAAPDKRAALVARLLADNQKYAEHWISFWNDLLRNEDGVTYFSETAGRKSITDWLHRSRFRRTCRTTEFVTQPAESGAAGGSRRISRGVNWRGETSAAVTPWMQASQNTAQVFLGVNLKCNACHDSFVSKWKLKDAYALAGYFSPEAEAAALPLRCRAGRIRRARLPVSRAEPRAARPTRWPIAARRPRRSSPIRATAACRARSSIGIWQRLLGHGIVGNPDEMDGKPWSPALLDWLASDFVEHGYDLKHLIADHPDVARLSDAGGRAHGGIQPRGYAFHGRRSGGCRPSSLPMPSARSPASGASINRECRAAVADAERARRQRDPLDRRRLRPRLARRSNDLTRALGRPIRDQVISSRAATRRRCRRWSW